jgi:hypothetical protein
MLWRSTLFFCKVTYDLCPVNESPSGAMTKSNENSLGGADPHSFYYTKCVNRSGMCNSLLLLAYHFVCPDNGNL